MFFQLNITLLLLLLTNQLIIGSMQRTCQQILSKQDILALGVTNVEFLLITKDYFIFTSPKSWFNPELNTLYLTESIPMWDKYPNLYQSQLFQLYKNFFLNGFFYSYQDTNFLILSASGNNIIYNLEQNTVTNNSQQLINDNNLLISTDMNTTISLKNTGKSIELQLVQILFSQGELKFSIQPDIRFVCTINNQIKYQTEECLEKTFWPIKSGFIYNSTFYIVTQDNVLIFDNVTTNDIVNYIDKRLIYFIYCHIERSGKFISNFPINQI